MDAVKFIDERNRICKSFGRRCNDCPANKKVVATLMNGKKSWLQLLRNGLLRTQLRRDRVYFWHSILRQNAQKMVH